MWCQRRILLILMLLVSYSVNSNTVTQPILGDNLCSDIIPFKGIVFFCLDHPIIGKEVHYSDGSQLGTKVLKDIDLGEGSSTPFFFFEFKNHLYFLAETTQTGYGLWRTDGTESGTKLIRQIAASDAFPEEQEKGFIETLSNNAFFYVGKNLFKTDGTHDGTGPINIEFAPYRYYAIKDGKLHVIALEGGQEVLSAITVTGEVEAIKKFPSSTQVWIEDYQFLNNLVLIVLSCSITDPHAPNCEQDYWLSDGRSEPGTKKFRSRTEVTILGVIDNKLIFYSQTPTSDDLFARDLMSTDDGANDTLITSVYPDFSRTHKIVDGKIRFAEHFNSATYITDGTSEGTHLIPIDYHFQSDFNGLIIGVCADNISAVCSSNSDGSVVTRISANNISYTSELKSSIGIYYSTFNDHSLWLTNGNASSTTRVFNHENQTSLPLTLLATEGQRLYYYVLHNSGSSSARGYLWQSDGTQQGTYQLYLQYRTPPTPPLTPEERRKSASMVPIRNLLLEEEET